MTVKKFRYAKLDKWRCRVYEGIAPLYFLNKNIKIPSNIGYEEYIIRIYNAVDNCIKIYGRNGPMCGRCLAECLAKIM